MDGILQQFRNGVPLDQFDHNFHGDFLHNVDNRFIIALQRKMIGYIQNWKVRNFNRAFALLTVAEDLVEKFLYSPVCPIISQV